MRPSHLEPPGLGRPDRQQVRSQDHLTSQVQLQSQTQSATNNTRRSRYEGTAQLPHPATMHAHGTDSWIDLSSQPSSSSLASQNDEIITTGLQIRRDSDRRSRHLRLGTIAAATDSDGQPRATSVGGSSQDEYDESESESDRVLSSSNEDVSMQSNEDEDETQTALGVATGERHIFTPQPNAFSHPPQSRHGPVSTSMPVDSYFPSQQQAIRSPPPSSSHRLPSNRVPTIQRAPPHRLASNISPDHDAALRASLTTLLSCANAVRKDRDPAPQPIHHQSQPTVLRLVPESELNARDRQITTPQSPKPVPKRKSRDSSKDRQAKKIRPVAKNVLSPEEMLVSPTMMTWFISAGVVIVFSAISFSAGYAWGREVGRYETHIGLEGASCGREVMRSSRSGLTKIRLGSAGA